MSRLLVFNVLLIATACQTGPQMDYDSLELVEAYGTVRLDGKPLANAVVTFEAADGTFSYGLTDARGIYQLHFDSVIRGVTPGPKRVRISTAKQILGLNADEEDESATSELSGLVTSSSSEKVPQQYNAASQLTLSVTADQTEYNFDLTSH